METYRYYLTHQTGEVIEWIEAEHLGQATEKLRVSLLYWFPINNGNVVGAGVVEDKGNKELKLGIYWIKA